MKGVHIPPDVWWKESGELSKYSFSPPRPPSPYGPPPMLVNKPHGTRPVHILAIPVVIGYLEDEIYG